MAVITLRALTRESERFLAHKRSLGHPYHRGAFTLRSFFKHARTRAAGRSGPVDLKEILRSWLARSPDRKPVSITIDLGVIRQFCLFRRRYDRKAFVPDRTWAPQSTESAFLPRILSEEEIAALVRLTATVPHPIRATTLRTLLLVLYRTGLRPGEAVRLRLEDVDLDERCFTIRESKGKTRIVPSAMTWRGSSRPICRYARVSRPLSPQGPGWCAQTARPSPSTSPPPHSAACFAALASSPPTAAWGPDRTI